LPADTRPVVQKDSHLWISVPRGTFIHKVSGIK
jgi:hypothetical protein